jgi:hypothetical protein
MRNSGRLQVENGWAALTQVWAQVSGNWWMMLPIFWHDTLPLDDDKNGDGAYYACHFYDATYDTDEPVGRTSNENSLFPWNSEWKDMARLKYTYSAYGEEIDKI